MFQWRIPIFINQDVTLLYVFSHWGIKWRKVTAATTGRIQNDRNVVPVAFRLIKPMGNMPFYKEIIMFEKIQNKTTINHKVAIHAFTWLKKTSYQQMKHLSNQPKTSVSHLVLFPHSLTWIKNSLSKNCFEPPVLSFCTFPSIRSTYPLSSNSVVTPSPPLNVQDLLSFSFLFLRKNPETQTIYPDWLLIGYILTHDVCEYASWDSFSDLNGCYVTKRKKLRVK